MTDQELIALAEKARQNSYSPYSNFKVGAALLCENGNVFLGTNVENASFGPTNCAERSAIFAAVSNGERNFEAIAIIGDGKRICYPCGVCRQVMAELLPSAKVICAKNVQEYEVYSVADLLPNAFGKCNTNGTKK